MTPYYADDWLTVLIGDCRERLAELPAESVHCVVTSPPYWGMRDYGEAGQLGLEPTPEEYVANMVAVFREVKRVLRDDGTLWLNLGDSYAASTSTNGGYSEKSTLSGFTSAGVKGRVMNETGDRRPLTHGLKPKDLVGIPWRVAFALQADGWYLRSDIIWAKPNPMPESVTDRPTKSHEYMFLLTKSPRYYYDADAVRERGTSGPSDLRKMAESKERIGGLVKDLTDPHMKASALTNIGRKQAVGSPERNLRTVWTIATSPYPGAHYATFPQKLVEPCIKAGTSECGCCPECGAPWGRVQSERPIRPAGLSNSKKAHGGIGNNLGGQKHQDWLDGHPWETKGWSPSCAHTSPLRPVPATVLDPFAGSGTTLMVAQRLSRRAIGIDLSADYLDQAMVRNAQTPMGLGA